MSDLLVIGLTIIAVWSVYLLATYRHRVAQLAVEERRTIRMEQREERERGIVPRVEAAEKLVRDMHTEQKTFLANARAR